MIFWYLHFVMGIIQHVALSMSPLLVNMNWLRELMPAIAVIVFTISGVIVVTACLNGALKNSGKSEETENDQSKFPDMYSIAKSEIYDNRLLANVNDVMAAIRETGFCPEYDGGLIYFMVQEETFTVDCQRLPDLAIIKSYSLDPGMNLSEIERLKRAAQSVSDSMMMVKVSIEDDAMHYYIVSIFENYSHFRNALTRYVDIINQAERQMRFAYDKLKEEDEESGSTALTEFFQRSNNAIS